MTVISNSLDHGSEEPVAAIQAGDYVVCSKTCATPDLQSCFELCPVPGEAFQVIAVGRPAPFGFRSGEVGLRLAGVRDPEGDCPGIGLPTSHFRICTEAEALPGWRKFLHRLDQNRISRFHQMINAGVAFENLPPILRDWWAQRY